MNGAAAATRRGRGVGVVAVLMAMAAMPAACRTSMPILSGARPVEWPVEPPMRFDVAIDAEAALALGTIGPGSLRLRRDEAIA